MLINNNHASFSLVVKEIWQNISKSQIVMSMFVILELWSQNFLLQSDYFIYLHRITLEQLDCLTLFF